MGRTERENRADKKREGKKKFCSRDDCLGCRISNIGGCHTNTYAVIRLEITPIIIGTRIDWRKYIKNF